MAPRWRAPVGLLALVALLYVRRKQKAKAKAKAIAKKIAEAKARGEEPPKKKPDPTAVIWSLIKPKKWFAKGKDGEGSTLMLTILVLAGLRSVQITVSTRVVQVLDELMNSRDIAAFKQYMLYSVVISLFGTCIRQTWNFTSAHLVVLWRQRLTDRLHEEYFKGQAYYFLGDGGGTDGSKVTDPDQRISEDVKKTAEGFAQIFQEVLYAGTAGVLYTVMLYSHYGIVVTVAPWLYLVVAQKVVSKVAPVKWSELFGALAAKIASFRDALTRIMLNFEAITALKGQAVENSIVTGRYDLAVAQMKKNHVNVARHGFTMSFMYQHWLATIIGGVVILPGVYREKKAMASLEEIAEVRGVVGHQYMMIIAVLGAAWGAVQSMTTLKQLSGNAGRVAELFTLMKDLRDKKSAQDSTSIQVGDCIEFDDVTIRTPKNIKLVEHLSFKLEREQSLLLTGHNGAGKSSIFRCLGGLWTIPHGSITKPGSAKSGLDQEVFYLPQKPYNVLGTLYDQLTYPEQIGEGDTTLTKERLVEILDMVDLGYLATRDGVLDSEVNWEDECSLGEKQRLAIARLVYHQPRFAILDECTSAVSSEMEREMYRICRNNKITYITISHRPALMAFHERILTIGDGNLGFTLNDVDHSRIPQKEMALAMSSVKAAVDQNAERKIAEGIAARSAQYKHLESRAQKEVKSYSTAGRFRRLLKISMGGSGTSKVAIIAVCIIVEQFLRFWHQTITGEMFTILMNQARNRVPSIMLQSTLASLCLATIQLATRFTSQRLEVTMSEELTSSLLSRYISGDMFYKMGSLDKRIRDPDQRIAEDIKSFCESATGMFAEVISPIAQTAFFVGVVARMLGKWAPVGMVGYFGATTVVLQMIMPNYKALVAETTELEGKFKFVHTRVKSCAESIAFFGGDSREFVVVDRRFRALMKVVKRKINVDLQFNLINAFITEELPGQIQWLLRMAYGVFQAGTDSEIIADKGASMNKNQLLLLTANGQVFEGLRRMFAYIEKFASLSGYIQRLGELDEVLTDLSMVDETTNAGQGEYKASEESLISFDGVDIVTPSGICLAKDVSMSVTPSTPLMVTGANAVGKTSLFRVLGGLWPVYGGNVTVPAQPGESVPGIGEIFLVPQRIYMCIGTLADQLTYPKRFTKEERTVEKEQEMKKLLELVGIDYLVERWQKDMKEGESGWDYETKWEDVLSLGEQQRTGMARLFYHKPKFGVLDECTSAVSVDVEEKLYRTAAEKGIACISISQRLALTEFHSQELHLGAPNPQGWTLTQIAPVDAPSDPEDNDVGEMTVSPASSTVDLARPSEGEADSVTDEDSEGGGVLVGG